MNRSRRRILKAAATSALGISFGGGAALAERSNHWRDYFGAPPVSRSRNVLHGIDPSSVDAEYDKRGLERLSDVELVRSIAEIVSRPCKGLTSFTLHAPLELMARYGLLPFVHPTRRRLARLQMTASAAAYEAGTTPLADAESVRPFADASAAGGSLRTAFEKEDTSGFEAIALQIAKQFGTPAMVHLLTPLAVPSLAAIGHSHIALWLLLRHGAAGETNDATLMRAALRYVAAEPAARMQSFDGMQLSGAKPLGWSAAEIEEDVFAKLADPPHSSFRDTGLRSVVEAGERTGNADELFGIYMRHRMTDEEIDATFRAIMRVAAQSMLQHSTDNAKFGWSHCLSQPQAACGLASAGSHRKLCLGASFVWISAFRSVVSQSELDLAWTPPRVEAATFDESLNDSPGSAAAHVWYASDEDLPLIRQEIATRASIRNDQHLVKYVRACFDMSGFDPGATRLYLAAAARLCALWIQDQPRGEIGEDWLAGRSTPG